ncbi:MAG: endonuclease/exonuclease/phosphatase family protein [Chthoniobacterales bacterium]|nr:endonuclease/exonuclease/phosphatase family protein [Chthoniobacterales bacterium]
MHPRRVIFAAALAILSVAGALHADDDAPSAEPKLTVAWWNLRNYLLEPVRDEEGRTLTPAKTPESIASIVETVAGIKPDILALAEVGTRRDLIDLQRRLKQAGVDLPHAEWVDGADQHRHLALLSRFPVEAGHDTTSAVNSGGLPRRVQRGFLDCKVAVHPDFTLRVLGAHLKSPRVVPEFDQDEQRRGESLLLRQRVVSILSQDPGTPLLLVGDLNDAKNSPAVAGLTGRRGTPTALTILPLTDRGGDAWTYHWAENDTYTRVDYMMASNALRRLFDHGDSRIPRERDWMKASDHRPLVAVFKLSATSRKP